MQNCKHNNVLTLACNLSQMWEECQTAYFCPSVGKRLRDWGMSNGAMWARWTLASSDSNKHEAREKVKVVHVFLVMAGSMRKGWQQLEEAAGRDLCCQIGEERLQDLYRVLVLTIIVNGSDDGRIVLAGALAARASRSERRWWAWSIVAVAVQVVMTTLLLLIELHGDDSIVMRWLKEDGNEKSLFVWGINFNECFGRI